MYMWPMKVTLLLHAYCVIKEKQLGNHTWEAVSENYLDDN